MAPLRLGRFLLSLGEAIITALEGIKMVLSKIMRGFSLLMVMAMVVTMAPAAGAAPVYAAEQGAEKAGRKAQAAAAPLPDVAPAAGSSMAASQVLTPSAVLTTSQVLADQAAALAGGAAVETVPPVLAMRADPLAVEPGEVVTYSVAITNVADVPLAQVVLSDTLPVGVVYVAQSAVGFEYSPRDKRLTWAVAELAPGHGVRGGFQVRAQGLGIGELITNTVSASSPAMPLVTALAVVEVAPPRQNQVWATPEEGGRLRSEDRRVDLRVPPGAVRGRTQISYTPRPDITGLPPGVQLPFSLEAVDEQGQSVHQFDAPLAIALAFAPSSDPLVWAQPGLATLDEATGQWQPIPVTIDRSRGVVQAEIEHFSLFAGASETYLVERMSSIRGAQPNLFSLSLGYRYPFALPPGRGGLTPRLGLSFNSSSYTAVSGHYSLPGFGWEFTGADSIYITPGDENNSEATLTLQGTTYSLRRVDDTTWFAKENPFLKITVSNLAPLRASPPATWVITTPDGTRYTFDVTTDSQSNTVASFYWKDCTNPDPDLKHKRWVRIPLTGIQDPHGNTASYTWSAEVDPNPIPNCSSRGYTRFVRLASFSYNGGAVQVALSYVAREDLLQDYPDITWRLYPSTKLDQVTVQVKEMGTGTLRTARSYTLGQQSTYSGVTYRFVWEKPLNLHDIWEKDPGGASLPVTHMNYTHNRFADGGGQDDYGAMTSLSNGYGGSVSFTSIARDGLDHPLILSQRTEDPGVSGSAVATWTYSGTNWDTAATDAKMAAGYATVTVRRPDGAVEEHDFWQSELASNGERIDHRAGREKEVRTLTGQGGSQLSRTVSSWIQTIPSLLLVNYSSMAEHLKPRFVRKEAEETYQDGQPLLRREYYYQSWRQGAASNTYQYGNLTEVREIPRAGAAWGAPVRSTYTWYFPNTTAWIIDKPGRQELYTGCSGTGCSGNAVTQTFFYYDDATADGQEVTPPVQGLLRRQKTGLNSLWSSTSYEYWVTGTRRNGNLRSVTDALNHTNETVYDSVFQAYPVCVANAKGQATIRRFYGVPGSGTGQVGSTSPCYNTTAGDTAWQAGGAYVGGRFFGEVQAEQDANAATTGYTYDVWGRPTEVTRPGESGGPTVRTSFSNYASASTPFRMQVEQRDNVNAGNSPNYLVIYTFYDGFGQVVQTQAEAADSSQVIVASTKFTALGQVERQDAAYFDPTGSQAAGVLRVPNWTSPKPGTQTAYDALGRVVRVTHPDNSAVRSYYTFLNTTASPYPMTAEIDELNHQTIRETDALGRLVSARQFTGTYTGNPGWSDAAYAQSRYAYDVADRLVDVWDPDNNNTHVVYDALGRKTSMTDPDMGTWSYGYDLAGNLTRQTDARNQRLCFYYDELNRLKGKTYSTGTGACAGDPGYGGYAVKYYYDVDENGAAVANGKGRRTVMVDGSGNTRWLYDSRGRVTSETRVIGGAGGGTFQTQWTSYDAMDRVRTLVYPDGESVTLAYTSQGPIKSVAGTSTFVGDTLYNALGQVTERRLGSTAGVIRQQYAYTAVENFRLVTLKSGANSPGYDNRQNLTYTYDDAGNVLTVVDAAAYGGSQTQTFTYDALNRLLTAQATGGSYGAYSQRSYAYSGAGNLGTFEGAALGYNDAAHRHAATHVAGVQKYWYDQNGNAVRRINGSQDITLAYDAENHLTGISGGGVTATYVYDGDGQRIKATVGSVTTVYPSASLRAGVGAIYERDNGTTVRKYYYADGVRVAMRTGGATYYLLGDHLTSTALTLDGAGNRLNTNTELRYYPYGAARYDTLNQQTIYRYTGQRIETGTGLYDYGARWYDPAIGRFLAADTIVPEPGDPQSLNRYSYTLNNPVRFRDPSGHAAEATGGVADLYAWARLLDQTRSDKFHGWLQERDSAWAVYLIAQHEGAPQEVLDAAASSLEAKQTALLNNGYKGVAAAQDSTFRSYGVDVGSGAIELSAGLAGAVKFINPWKVRFSQDSIKPTFGDGGTIDDLASRLRNGTIDPNDVPPIRLVERSEGLFSLDNRRLEAFRRADMDVPYTMATKRDVIREGWKFTTRNNGVSIRIRGE